MKNKKYNHLINEKSPYLLQHAENPVDWYPWGEEAFERAKKEDKPIFLSIGYSTCHWCHVMEHESFEDPQVARLMNEAFINIKVDREERPDIDEVYMTVCQMLTGSGGWPLTIIMTPDKQPFFAATYIPKENRFGRIGMLELIPRVQDAWINKRDEVMKSAREIAGALSASTQVAPAEEPAPEILGKAYQYFEKTFDSHNGGFGNAPKFPSPHNLQFLLRYWKRTGSQQALRMVEQTLTRMRLGGIYDHVGFGFHRYSTDSRWLVPHFEKMLYDQAMLIMAYSEAYQATGNLLFRETVAEIVTYVLRDMTSPAGGFYSAEDADSEGEEGKFYLWTVGEIRKALPDDLAELVIRVYNVTPEGNFQEEATGKPTGRNILHLNKPLSVLAAQLGMDEEELRAKLEIARKKLFEERKRRVPPLKDDKILTDWNGLMVAALSKASRIFGNPQYAAAAGKALKFIRENLFAPDHNLLHRFREGEAKIPGFLSDYAYLIWGLLEYYETTFDVQALQTAVDLNRVLEEHFWDSEHGGYFTTADHAEDLLVRKKDLYDGAIPSGNSVQFLNLLRLGRITARPELEEMAQQVARIFAAPLEQHPAGYTMFLSGYDFAVGPSYEVVISGVPNRSDTEQMLRSLRSRFAPNKIVLLRPPDEDAGEILSLAGFLKDMKPLKDSATAYVCRNYACELPTTDTGKMLSFLK